MSLFLLPLFLFVLFIKNAESWLRIAMEAFGAQAVIIALILINGGVGVLLYREIQLQKDAKGLVGDLEEKLKNHKLFWDQLAKEFPEHTTVQDAQKTLDSK